MTKNQKGTPPTTAARVPRPARSKSKGARATSSSGKRRTTAYPAKVRAEAETLMREEGMAAAHDATGVPKATLSRWAKAASIDLGEDARRRTAAATEVVKERVERARVDTVRLLEDHIGEAGSYLSTIVRVNAAAAEAIAGLDPSALELVMFEGEEVVEVNDEAAKALAKLARALGDLPLAVRDAEGIVTRAIHDLQLLRGEATERGELVVEFGGIPRPDPRGQDVQTFQHDDDA